MPDGIRRWARLATGGAALLMATVVVGCGNGSSSRGTEQALASGQLESAAALSESALADARLDKERSPRNLANALDNAGVVALGLGELDAAQKNFTEAAETRKLLPGVTSAELARSDLNLALVDFRRGNLGEARRKLVAAIGSLKAGADLDAALVEAALHNALAEVEISEAQLSEAAAELDNATQAVKRAGDGTEIKALVFSIAGNRARLARARADFRGAEAQFRVLLDAQRAALPPGNTSIAVTLANLAEIHAELGDAEQALALYLEALSILDQRAAAGGDAGAVIGNLAQLSNILGRQAEAMQLASRSLAIQERSLGTDSPALGPTLSILSDIAFRSGDMAGAERYIGRERRIYDKAYGPDHPLGLSALMNAGELLRQKKDFTGAADLYARAQAIIDRAFGNRSLQQVLLLAQRGELAVSGGRAEEAVALYREGLQLGGEILGAGHPRLDRLEIGLAEAELKLGRRAAALARFDRTLLRISENAGDSSETENRQRNMVALRYLAVLGDATAAPTSVADGFRVAQYLGQTRAARALAQTLARKAVGPGPLADLLRSRQDDLAALHLVEESLVRFAARTGSERDLGQIDDLRKRRNQLSATIAATEAKLASAFPAYAELENPRPLELAEVSELLPPKTALLAYAATPVGVWGWAVRGTRVEWRRLDVDAEELEKLVRDIRAGLDPNAARETDSLGLPAGFPAAVAHRLFRILVEPFAAELRGAETVYVAPSGPLFSVPFEVFLSDDPGEEFFMTADQYRGARWLVRDYAFAYLPAVSSLRVLRAGAGAGAGGGSFLGIGDPLLGDHTGEDPDLVPALRMMPRGTVTASNVFHGSRADTGAIMAMPSLPDTAAELTTMRASFPAGDLMLRRQASETLLRARTDLETFSVIAFATHGLVAGDLTGFAEPGLVLTPPASFLKDDDGLLSVSDISELRLRADWVILSACNTAAPDGSPGAEGLSGLARAFFYAGARSLLVSHWPVASEPTVTLTTTMISDVARNGSSRALAHRNAVLAMLANENEIYMHPTIWAPFVLVGAAQ